MIRFSPVIMAGGRLVSVTDPMSQAERYGYDQNDNLA
jgi:YD repeat-containing protein